MQYRVRQTARARCIATGRSLIYISQKPTAFCPQFENAIFNPVKRPSMAFPGVEVSFENFFIRKGSFERYLYSRSYDIKFSISVIYTSRLLQNIKYWNFGTLKIIALHPISMDYRHVCPHVFKF